MAFGRELISLSGAQVGTTALAWDAQGRRLASAGNGGLVQLWDPKKRVPVRELKGHSGRVTGLAWSPNGRRLASAGVDKLMVWNVEEGKPAFTRSASMALGDVSWNRNGSLLAYSEADGRIKICNGNTGKVIRSLTYRRASLPTQCPVFIWRPEGDRIVWENAPGSFQDVEVRSGDVKTTYSYPQQLARPTALRFSANEKYLATSGGGTVLVWSAGQGARPYWQLAGQQFAWDSTGSLLAVSVAEDDRITIHDVEKKALIRRLMGHQNTIYSLAWEPGQPRLASASADATVRLWDVSPEKAHPGEHTIRLFPPLAIQTYSAKHDGSQVALGLADGSIHLWDPLTGKMGATIAAAALVKNSQLLDSEWGPDGNRLAFTLRTGDAGPIQLVVWDVKAGRVEKQLELGPAPMGSFRWSPNGELLAVPCSTGMEIWSIDTGKRLRGDGWGWQGNNFAWSPDSELLAIGQASGVRRFTVKTGVQQPFLQDIKNSTALAFSPDGQFLAAGSWNEAKLGEISIFKRMDNKVSRGTMEGHATKVEALSWSPDSRRLISVASGETKLWDATSGSEILTFVSESPIANGRRWNGWYSQLSLFWSANGRRFGWADSQSIRFWDADPGYEAAAEASSGNRSSVTSASPRNLRPISYQPNLGFIRTWRFADSLEQWRDQTAFVALPPEKVRAIETEAASAKLETSDAPFIDLNARQTQQLQNVSAYAVREIVVKDARKVKLLAGSDDALRIWLNGELVHEALKLRMAQADEDTVPIALKPGVNRMLVEVSQATGQWGFLFRIVDESGNPLYLAEDGALGPLDDAK